ncbi:MAG: hypothetical protein LUD47_01005 [Clostridia bacterium]|nr:hypothetical protein [Clostridia bacterium]
MNLITIIIIVAVAVFAVLGFIIGLVKGFAETRPWTSELVLTVIVTCLVAYYTQDSLSGDTYFAVILATCVACIVVFIIIDKIIKAAFGDGKSGMDRFFGGVALMIKGAALAAIILGLALVILNAVFPIGKIPENPGGITEAYFEFIETDFWIKAAPIVFDGLLIGLILSSIRAGFEHGILSALWGFIQFVLVIGCIVGAYFLAFQTSVFSSLGDSMGANMSSSLGEDMQQLLGRLIVMLIAAVVLIVIVVTICMIIRRAVRHARSGAAVSVVDGIFGGLVLGAICIAVFMALGAFLTQYYSPYSGIDEITFIDDFIDRFAHDGTFSSIFFSHNILLSMESVADLFRSISMIEHMV